MGGSQKLCTFHSCSHFFNFSYLARTSSNLLQPSSTFFNLLQPSRTFWSLRKLSRTFSKFLELSPSSLSRRTLCQNNSLNLRRTDPGGGPGNPFFLEPPRTFSPTFTLTPGAQGYPGGFSNFHLDPLGPSALGKRTRRTHHHKAHLRHADPPGPPLLDPP